MKKVLATTGAVTLGLVAALAVGETSSASADPHQKHLTVVAQDSEGSVTPSTFFSATPVQNGQGSEDAPVYRKGSKVGLAETVYTWTRGTGDPILMLECSVELPEGRILFAGTFHGAEMATGGDVPVVGGTGAYAGVAGVVHMVPSADGSSTALTFDLTH